MDIDIDALGAELQGRQLPGGSITIEPHESFNVDHAVGASDDAGGVAHPVWFILASLRGMGISVADLERLARSRAGDTLLYGGVTVDIERPLTVGETYRTTARITEVGRSALRNGSALDRVVIAVDVHQEAVAFGTVTATYLFKRGDLR